MKAFLVLFAVAMCAAAEVLNEDSDWASWKKVSPQSRVCL